MNQEPCYDGENSTKNHLMGIFPAAGKNLHAARSVALVLRDHVGDRQLAKQSRRLTLLPWLDMPLLQAIFIWMSKVGSFAFSFLPVMFCIAIPLGLARENKGVAAFAGFVGYAVMNGGQLLADREGYSAHHRRRDPEGQQYPEHYRHSVNRYRDPRGGDRRNYRLAAA